MPQPSMKAPGSRGRAPFPGPKAPLAPILVLAASAIGCASALLRRDMTFRLAFGDALAIEAILLLGSAWFVYLKKDGIRLFPAKGRGRTAESWKDRVPGLGDAPSIPFPIPGEKGPEDPDYRRLILAEEELRKKIMGDGNLDDASSNAGKESGNFAKKALTAGIILMLAALCLEYVP
jgi:hypothetical protein